MSIIDVKVNPNLPEGYRGLTIHGLPGHPKTAVALGGKDEVTGEWWQVPIESNPEHPSDSLTILIPNTVPFVRVLTADEFLESVDGWVGVPAALS